MQRLMNLFGAGLVLTAGLGFVSAAHAQEIGGIPQSPVLEIQSTQVRYIDELDLLVFEQELGGEAGSVLPPSSWSNGWSARLGLCFSDDIEC